MTIQLKDLEVMDYPPLTEDLEQAKEHLDLYGMALIKNVLSIDEIDQMDERLTEQFYGEENHYDKQSLPNNYTHHPNWVGFFHSLKLFLNTLFSAVLF